MSCNFFNPWTFCYNLCIFNTEAANRVTYRVLKYKIQKEGKIHHLTINYHPFLTLMLKPSGGFLLSLHHLLKTNTNPLLLITICDTPTSTECGLLRRSIENASSQPQSQFFTAGRVDRIWMKADIAEKEEGLVTRCLGSGVSTRQDPCRALSHNFELFNSFI